MIKKEDGSDERTPRRGQQIFQIALEMEVGEDGDSGVGPETLLYLADALARTAALSSAPRRAIEEVIKLLDAVDGAWFAKHQQKAGVVVTPKGETLADVALEMTLGKATPGADTGGVAAGALKHLVDAIVHIAALNSDPRQIIEFVVHALDEADVDAARREHLK